MRVIAAFVLGMSILLPAATLTHFFLFIVLLPFTKIKSLFSQVNFFYLIWVIRQYQNSKLTKTILCVSLNLFIDTCRISPAINFSSYCFLDLFSKIIAALVSLSFVAHKYPSKIYLVLNVLFQQSFSSRFFFSTKSFSNFFILSRRTRWFNFSKRFRYGI